MTDPSEPRVRCFFALPLSEHDCAAVIGEQERLAALSRADRRLRWLAPDKLHLTLKFLGSIPEQSVARLAAVVASQAGSREPPSAEIAEYSAFPRPERATVVVLRLLDSKGRIERLAAELESAAELEGVPRERRAFNAHVTLARLKGPTNVSRLIAGSAPRPRVVVFHELVLFSSELGPQGSRYRVVARAPFAAE